MNLKDAPITELVEELKNRRLLVKIKKGVIYNQYCSPTPDKAIICGIEFDII